MPKLEHDHFALVGMQTGEGVHGRAFRRRFGRFPLEPVARLDLPQQAAEQPSPIVECAVPKGSDQVMLRQPGGGPKFKQRPERVVEDILRLSVAQAKRPPIQNHFGGALIVEVRRPIWLGPGVRVRWHFNR